MPRLTILLLASVASISPCTFSQASDPEMIAAARKEGSVNWYTTQIVNQFAKPAAERFEQSYGIKVNFTRNDPSAIVLRIMGEAKSGKTQADVFDSAPAVSALKSEGLVLHWIPEAASRFNKKYVDSEGFWTATNFYVLTPAFNTELVKKGSQPKTWNDLLDPRWKGKIAWASQLPTAGAAGFVGLVVTEMGEDQGLAFLKKLSLQNITPLGVTSRQVVDQMISGEYELALQIFNHHPVISANKGAPVDWIAMNPSFEYASPVAITKNSPHPNAAKLFVEFLVSPEGQTLYRDADYMPIDEAIPTKTSALRPDGVKFRSIWFTPEHIEKNGMKWMKIFDQLFR